MTTRCALDLSSMCRHPDPFRSVCDLGPVDELPSRQPALTLVGGRAVHHPDGLLGSAHQPI